MIFGPQVELEQDLNLGFSVGQTAHAAGHWQNHNILVTNIRLKEWCDKPGRSNNRQSFIWLSVKKTKFPLEMHGKINACAVK